MSRRKVTANPKGDSSPRTAEKPHQIQFTRLKDFNNFLRRRKRMKDRDETISLLKDDEAYLQGELGKKDELIHQLLSMKDKDNSTIMTGKSSHESQNLFCVKRKHRDDRKAPLKKAKQLKSISYDDEEEDSSSVSFDSSEDSSMDSRQMKKSLKSPTSSSSSRHPVKPSCTDNLIGRIRARNTMSIIAHYKMATNAFDGGGSMKAASYCIGADRSTVSMTVPIAELSIAAPDIFKKEKLSTFIN